MNCCEAMEAARQSGSDNEGFGPLVTGLRIGMDLPEIRFCPWCGKSLVDSEDEQD